MRNDELSNENQLLSEIQKSMTDMQNQMQSTFVGLEKISVSGKAQGVEIILSGTYKVVDIIIQKESMKDGLEAFKTYLKQAITNAHDEVQKATQAKTMELLQSMNVPDEIRGMSSDGSNKSDD